MGSAVTLSDQYEVRPPTAPGSDEFEVRPPAGAEEQTPGFFKQAWQALTQPQEPGMYSKSPVIDQPLTTIHNVGGRAVAGVGGMVAHPLDTLKSTYQTVKSLATIPAFDEQWKPVTGDLSDPSNPMSPDNPINRRVAEFQEEWKQSPRRAVENVAGDVAGMYAGGKLLEVPGEGTGALKARVAEKLNVLRPTKVPIGANEIPILAGEADPRKLFYGVNIQDAQQGMKSGGIGSQSFRRFADEQHAQVKNVIRSVAQQTSGMMGPMAEEPAAAVGAAAEATFNRARPMYQALDKSLITVPNGFETMNALAQQAIARAKKLGVDIDTSGAESYYTSGGKKFGPGSSIYESAKGAGIPSEGGAGPQPISTFMRVRSELLKMARSTSDDAKRYAIGNEVSAMNNVMEETLRGTPLYDNFVEANRLWAKGHALEDVADAFHKATEGTPAAKQAPGIAKVPTKVSANKIVSRLNDLDREGILGRAFTSEEANSLRQAGDILDRASTKIGTGGVPVRGYGYHSMMFDALKRLPMRLFARVMTTPEGVTALQQLEGASTPQAMTSAMARLRSVIAIRSAPKTAGEAKERINAIR